MTRRCSKGRGAWTARIAALAALALLAGHGSAPGQSVERDPAPVRDVGETTSIERDGQPAPVGVRLQKWIIDGHRKIEALELPGFEGVRILQLAAGEVTTVIRGERVERAEGEWWTVPPGEALGLETGDDSAILWAISVEPQ